MHLLGQLPLFVFCFFPNKPSSLSCLVLICSCLFFLVLPMSVRWLLLRLKTRIIIYLASHRLSDVSKKIFLTTHVQEFIHVESFEVSDR